MGIDYYHIFLFTHRLTLRLIWNREEVIVNVCLGEEAEHYRRDAYKLKSTIQGEDVTC